LQKVTFKNIAFDEFAEVISKLANFETQHFELLIRTDEDLIGNLYGMIIDPKNKRVILTMDEREEGKY